jgi:hypothetical protein
MIDKGMSKEYWCNDTESGKPKDGKRDLSHCHFVQFKSNVDWHGVQLRPLWSETDDQTSRTSERPSCMFLLSFPLVLFISTIRFFLYLNINLHHCNDNYILKTCLLGCVYRIKKCLKIFSLDTLRYISEPAALDFLCFNSIFDVFLVVYTRQTLFCIPW